MSRPALPPPTLAPALRGAMAWVALIALTSGAAQAKSAVKPGPGRVAPTVHGGPAEHRLGVALLSVWKGKHLRRGQTAVVVADPETGKLIYEVHSDAPLNPASNVKLVSTGAALETYGGDGKLVTRVLGRAPDKRGHVTGDLYILGAADPTFSTSRVARLADALVANGVTAVDGNIAIGPNTIRDAVTWASVRIQIVGGKHGRPAAVTVTPALPFISVTADVKSRRGRTRLSASIAYVGGTPLGGSDITSPSPSGGPAFEIRVSGRVRANRKATIRRSVPRRATYTALLLKHHLAQRGVSVSGQPVVLSMDDYLKQAEQHDYLPITLGELHSPAMRVLAARINKPSNNFLADRIAMTMGAAEFGGLPTMQKGVATMYGWLRDAGINPSHLVLDTGSGLSYNTKLSARQIVAVLQHAAGLNRQCSTSGDFVDSLSVAGRDGTLRRRFRATKVRDALFGKTGTLTGVIALSGLIEHKGRKLVFSIVTNGNRHRNRRNVRKQHEALVQAMHRYLGTEPLANKTTARVTPGTSR